MNRESANKIFIKRDFIEEIFLKYEDLLIFKMKKNNNIKKNEIKIFTNNTNNNKISNNKILNNEFISLYKINYNSKNIYKTKILNTLKNSKINLHPIKI